MRSEPKSVEGKRAWWVASGTASVLLAAVVGWSSQWPLGWASAARRPAPALPECGDADTTALVLAAEVSACSGAVDNTRLAGRLKRLERILEEDPAGTPQNREVFVLSFGLMALADANQEARYARLIQRTAKRLQAMQWDAARGCADADSSFGGTGYTRLAEPDLYHTALAIESLRRAGMAADDPYMQRALRFISRCQNLPSQTGAEFDAAKRGGFSIAPAVFDASGGVAGTDDSLNPCGSLTCAGVKSLVYCGLTKSDGRVTAGLEWLRRNYTLDANPGMGVPRCRLYDYYLSLAAVMTLLGEDTIVDAGNVWHDWCRELQQVLEREQESDGAWFNPDEADNLAEAHPLVTTSLAVMTLRKIASFRRTSAAQCMATAPYSK